MSFLTSMFKTEKPVIGMLHLRPAFDGGVHVLGNIDELVRSSR